MILIRNLEPKDVAAIYDIYTPFISNSAVSFEEIVPEFDDFKERIQTIANSYPFYVAVENGEILGYAYASKHRERPAYRWIVETSIYMLESARGKGIGKKLYSTLLLALREKNFHIAYGIITLPNDNSVKLHANCGFEQFVVHENAGWKLGNWHDVLWMKCILNPFTNPPLEPGISTK